MYNPAVRRRTTIEMDDALLAEARSVLGTRGLKETVDRALAEVVRASRRRALASRLASGAGLDFEERTTRAARQWRVPESS
jgi:Arc/MetJ family transcription regulator